ncbi:hypothetical protein F4804DRAFT_327903 [Jackrogersella minutella]|nr:hypothetical protein F4804DRAFT_327903 [Jackrogersella minutella]
MGRRRVNLDPYKEQITCWFLEEDVTQEQILENLQIEHGLNISRQTLQRNLKAWNVQKNGTDIDDLQNDLYELFEMGLTYERIIARLQDERPNTQISLRSLERRFKQWRLARNKRVTYTPEMVKHVQFYFFAQNNKDHEILTNLEHLHDIHISHAVLVRIRIENNMKRKITSENERQRLVMALEDFFDEYQRHSDALGDYGRQHLYSLVRRNSKLPLTREMIWIAYRRRYPEAIQQRLSTNVFFARPRKHKVPGPNYMWGMDGYLKLRFAGIEIYGAIDTYSRKLLWCKVCRSISFPCIVMYMYLNTIMTLGIRPWLTRSDHGNETLLLALVQHEMATLTQPEVHEPDANGGPPMIHRQGHRINDSHCWGSGKAQKIEQLWRQLRGGATDRWIKYFEWLDHVYYFNKDEPADQAALYAIYIPLIQRDVAEFEDEWNNHRIRYQPKKGHVVSGHVNQLWLNLNNPDVQNWGIDMEANPNTMELARRLLGPLEDYDFESFMAPDTQRVCDEWLERNPLQDIDDTARPHLQRYLELREYLQQYIEEGREPMLTFNEIPRGGVEWFQGRLRRHEEELAAAQRDQQQRQDENDFWDAEVH